MFSFGNLEKITKKRKRIGRGGGRGGQSTRGKDGQKKRSGAGKEITPMFEGGQMSLFRRIAKKGFVSFDKTKFEIVSLASIAEKFDANSVVSKDSLKEAGLIKNRRGFNVKVLGSVDAMSPMTFDLDFFSKSAKETILKFGGKIS